MTTTISLKLGASLLREIKILAAENGMSMNTFLTSRLEEIVRERKAYNQARRRALARLRDAKDLGWTPPKSRDDLHDR